MSKTYYEQFRNNQNGYNAKNSSKIRQQQPPPRPTAIKQSPRSDTFVVSNKQNERSPKFAKMNGTRQAPLPQLSDKKRSESLQRKPPPRPAQKLLSPSSDQIDYERKPVRFAQRANSRLPPANPQRPAPYTSDISNQPRRVRVSNDDYVIQRHRGPPTEYVYEDDYRSDSPIERSRQKRYVRVVRDLPYEEDDDVYYVEPPPPVRRTKVNRRPPPPTEYVYVDETPARVRSHRSRRPEVVYIDDDDDDRRVEYEDEYIYVDEHGNQVDYVDQRRKSPQYVEYIYEDELDRKRSQKPKIVYVDDDVDDRRRRRPPQLLPSKSQKKSKQPSSTRIVYD